MIRSVPMMVLPHRKMRNYPDCGDWFLNEDGTPAMVVSADTGNDLSNLAILLHEFIESIWCWKNDITEAEVNEFDRKWFEEHGSTGEPGYSVHCPYRVGHLIAEKFEREFLTQFGRMWQHHEESVNALYADRKAIPATS